MSHLDKINSEHCYQVSFVNDGGNVSKRPLTTNLLPAQDQYQMKRDLSYLFGRDVVGYKYLHSE